MTPGVTQGAPPDVEVLVPTCDRPAALAVTLAGLAGQSYPSFAVTVSNQGDIPADAAPEVRALARVLRAAGHPVRFLTHLPRRGLAEHRQFLLDQSASPFVWFVDDDVWAEPALLGRLVRALRRAGCGFVGSFVEAPSGLTSTLPADDPVSDAVIELWDGPVVPEPVRPGGPGWDRRHLHYAARLHRMAVAAGLDGDVDRLYKVAWIGGCVLYDRAKLIDAGGFSFWPLLPHEHVGEDVEAQLRVLARHGGAGLLPSGAWHLEVPTTMARREHDAPLLLRRERAAP